MVLAPMTGWDLGIQELSKNYIFNTARVGLGIPEEGNFEGGVQISLCFSLLLDSIKLTVAGPDPSLQGLLIAASLLSPCLLLLQIYHLLSSESRTSVQSMFPSDFSRWESLLLIYT